MAIKGVRIDFVARKALIMLGTTGCLVRRSS